MSASGETMMLSTMQSYFKLRLRRQQRLRSSAIQGLQQDAKQRSATGSPSFRCLPLRLHPSSESKDVQINRRRQQPAPQCLELQRVVSSMPRMGARLLECDSSRVTRSDV